MYEACRYGYALEDDVTWCDVLGDSALTAMEYRQDMKYYWRYGYGRKINYQASCLLLKDFMKAIRCVLIMWFYSYFKRLYLPSKHSIYHYELFNPFIAGTDFRRQNLTYVDVRFWHPKSIHALKE